MSYDDYRKSKGKQWKSLVSKSGKSKTQEVDVTILISFFEWNLKEAKLKPRRGKRMTLVVSNTAPYASILKKAVEKWRAFNCDCFDDNEDYMLLLENCKEALFLPGSHKEFFPLKRYKEEVGKDYARIVLYLCTRRDYDMSEGYESEEDDTTCSSSHTASRNHKMEEYFSDTNDTICHPVHFGPSTEKRSKLEPGRDLSTTDIENQIMNDETFAREMQLELDETHQAIIEIDVDNESKESNETDSTKFTDIPHLVTSLEDRVDKSSQYFLVIRRGIAFQRLLLLWQRECKKTSPEKVFRVKYIGERGINSGAISKECLTKAISDMGTSMFHNGAPIDSVYNIHNGQFRSCGEMVATSIAQGGPPPRFLHENVFKMLVNPDVDVANLNPDEHLTDDDQQLISRVKNDVSAHKNTIIDSGYTGVIDEDHKDDIVGTMIVNIVGKRLLYLKEFAEGLKLFGLMQAIRDNPDLTKTLFVAGNDAVDANYVFSLMCPQYSPEGSSKRVHEDKIMDNIQDFLFGLEDESVTGYAEAISWAADLLEEYSAELRSSHEDVVERGITEKFEMANLTPAGIFGWLTGQQHKPLNGIPLSVIVEFDHECMSRNPKHTICFPTVGACAKVITFPVAHMTDSTEFRNVFLLAYCKGGSFDNP
jgi:hypothetical protein